MPPPQPPHNPPQPETLERFTLKPQEAAIRYLCAADNRELEWHGGADLRSFYEAQWDRHAANEISVLVVQWNRAIIAQAAVHWQGKPTHPHLPDLQSVRVQPIFQGMGIGTRLLSACEKLVAAAHYSSVSLAVNVHNPRARSLYERVGYVVSGPPYRDYWSYTDAAGERHHVREMVQDMIKKLDGAA